MELIDIKMQEAFLEEQAGNYKNSIVLLQEAIKEFPDDFINLDYELAMMYFRNGFYKMAILELIHLYHITKDIQLVDFISEAYIEPNYLEFQENYKKNLCLLENYDLLYSDSFPEYNKLDVIPVWHDHEMAIFFADGDFVIRDVKGFCKDGLLLGNCVLMVNEFSVENIKQLKQEFYVKLELNIKIPIYLYYDIKDFQTMLQIHDVQSILEEENIVFIVGEDCLEAFFKDTQAILPEIVIRDKQKKVSQILEAIYSEREQYDIKISEWSKAGFYFKSAEEILNNIKYGKAKISFLTSRFTTALQFHSKNLMMSAKKLGLETEFLIEKSDVHRINHYTVWEHLEQFVPDIIVLMDHFRFENFPNLKDPVVITWIQDTMSVIMDPETPSKLTDRDFVLNHYISWKRIYDIGYDRTRMIDAPIPSNPEIYKPYEITEEEREQYACDICFVCHAFDINKSIEDFTASLKEDTRDIIRDLYLSYYNMAMEKGQIFYSPKEFKDFAFQHFFDYYQVELEDKILEVLIDNMFLDYSSKVYRRVLVKWLIEAGYTNIKLWGNGWSEDEKYSSYAMGPAENGEKLSKIYQCSKIVLGNNVNATAAARAWESMLSGAFYMVNYIPPEEDVVDIRKIIPSEELVIFEGKEDLIKKVHYYLNHEEERKKVIQRNRTSALEKMTFEILMKKILKKLKETL